MAPLTRADVASAAQALLADGYGFYLASHRTVLDRLDTAPFGLPVVAVDVLEPRELPWSAESFMRVYNRLNQVLFRPHHLALDYWVMIDLGLLPSAFLIITLPRDRLVQIPEDRRHSPAGRAQLEARIAELTAEADGLAFDGPIPVAGYCAAPMPVPGHWVGWSLCSIVPGLGTTVKGLGLEAYRATTLTGVTQYDNPALHLHRKFGRMRVLRAVLDLHPVPRTFVYRTELYEHADAPAPTFLLHCDDIERQRALQREIDAGRPAIYILPPGLDRAGHVPIYQATSCPPAR